MKIYLDTDAVSAIARKDNPRELDALKELVQAWQAKRVSLVTSEAIGAEIRNCTGPHRPDIEHIYNQLLQVPFVEKEVHVGYDSGWHDDLGAWSNPLYDANPDWQRLKAFGLTDVDAHHVMLAARSKCGYFVTCDRRSILNRRQQVEGAYSLRLLSPTEFVLLLSKSAFTAPE